LIKLGRVQSATPAKLQEAAKRWLSDGEYVLEVHPFGEPEATSERVDRSKPPEIGQAPEPKLPKLERLTLSNGLRVVLAERHEIPLVNISLLVDSGYAADQSASPGTARLTASLLDQGTRTRSALEISEQLAQLGARLTAASSVDSIFVRLSSLKDKL